MTGLSGLTANARRLEVIGNNISNVNTTAFKSSRMQFAPSLSRNLSLGSAPGQPSGGTNPSQIGLGVTIAGVQRNFNDGAINPTGVNSDLAMEGGGFFVVERGGQQYFTRAGAFDLNSDRDLVSIDGARVMGYAVDDDFNIVPGQLVPLNIPQGVLTIAEATQNVFMQGNLNATDGGQATMGAILQLNAPFSNVVGATPLVGTDTLVDTLQDPANVGVALFPSGGAPYEFTISGAVKGDRVLPDATLTIDGATTVDDLLAFINDTLGIPSGQVNPDGAVTGATIDATGFIDIVGNIGEDNNLLFDASNMAFADSSGAPVATTFDTSTLQSADGESVNTSYVVYDSLGQPLEVSMTLVFESSDNGGTDWRYFIDSADNNNLTNPDLNIGTGLLQFDTDGRLITTTPVSVTLQRDQTGAEDPLTFDVHFDSGDGGVSALADVNPDGTSELTSRFQDGIYKGTLSSFSVGEDGTITGGFTNGRTRTIGQVAVAAFTNPAGLIDAGGNLFVEGGNSGTAVITTAGQFGTGRMIGGALEQSNVDLGQEFINMILTTTGYSASSRVITTSDELLQQLTALVR
jgi:flagellar hook protein FlgE